MTPARDQQPHKLPSLTAGLPNTGRTAPNSPHQQGLEIQHVLFAQDDEGGRAAESVAAVGLQARHAAEAALPVLTTGARKREREWVGPSSIHGGSWKQERC